MNEKMTYEEAIIEVVELDVKDVICTSESTPYVDMEEEN